MKNIRIFLSENFHFSMVKFSVYWNRRVFVMSNNNYIYEYIIYFIPEFLTWTILSLNLDTLIVANRGFSPTNQ